jgi:sn-1 stearoyl-lipid 9-desaturase
MQFIDRVLQTPSYGWKDKNDKLVTPTIRQLFREAFSRINIFSSKKNWISLMSWLMAFTMLPFFILFLVNYFSFKLLSLLVVYSMIVMSVHATIWFHRFCTHKAYKFSSPIWRFITQNLVLKTFPEEIYVVSHHVHHAKSDEPGDPYNPQGGFMYCMLSDVNHQSIAKDLNEGDYYRASSFLKHTGVGINSYIQYRKWGSIASPFYTIRLWLFNWAFWFILFYMVGGPGLACALFSGAMFWFVFVRAFNYTGHGTGKDRHIDGIDFDRSNLSINQTRPGFFSGEWHNNHHLYPGSARAGFLKYQLDLAWVYIWIMNRLGAISSYHDSKKEFIKKYLSGK